MSENLGLGTMIRMLAGGKESSEAMHVSMGKKIVSLDLDIVGAPSGRFHQQGDDALRIGLDDGSVLVIKDEAQSCCETRYMRTDDDLAYYIGATLVGGEVRDATDVPKDEDHDGEHEIQFLVIHTDKGDVTFSNHNEHNGYYGGFSIECSIETTTETEAACT